MSHKYPRKDATPFDLEQYLRCEKHIELYLETIQEANDPAQLQQAMVEVAKARQRIAEGR